jgi:hypothetical protein
MEDHHMTGAEFTLARYYAREAIKKELRAQGIKLHQVEGPCGEISREFLVGAGSAITTGYQGSGFQTKPCPFIGKQLFRRRMALPQSLVTILVTIGRFGTCKNETSSRLQWLAGLAQW